MKRTELALVRPVVTVLLSYLSNSLALKRQSFQGHFITSVSSIKCNFCVLDNKKLANFILLEENNSGNYEGTVKEWNVLQNLNQHTSGVLPLNLITDWVTENFAKLDTEFRSVIVTYNPEDTRIAVKCNMQIYPSRVGEIHFAKIKGKKAYICNSISSFMQSDYNVVSALINILYWLGFIAFHKKYANAMSVYGYQGKFLFNLLASVIGVTDTWINLDNNTGKGCIDNKGKSANFTTLMGNKVINRLMRFFHNTFTVDSVKSKVILFT